MNGKKEERINQIRLDFKRKKKLIHGVEQKYILNSSLKVIKGLTRVKSYLIV